MRKTTDGLVLREVAVGEHDKLLTVLTPKEGKITLSAKGARSMKSKVLPLCRLFTYGNFEYKYSAKIVIIENCHITDMPCDTAVIGALSTDLTVKSTQISNCTGAIVAVKDCTITFIGCNLNSPAVSLTLTATVKQQSSTAKIANLNTFKYDYCYMTPKIAQNIHGTGISPLKFGFLIHCFNDLTT